MNLRFPFAFVLLLSAGAAAMALDVGDQAPDFTAKATGGETLSLTDYQGQWVVLYFYPKADTPGCTKQSCSLRDGFAEIHEEGAIILGASLDSVEDQDAFKAKYKLPFPLIADQDKAVAKAYDVVAPLGLFAKRKTFLIDPEGQIAHVFSKVKVSEHEDEVLQVLKALKQAASGKSE